jgi:DNA-binding XRE family transcriptional regulator
MTAKRHRFPQRRKAVGLTQEALANRLDIERSTVVRWESGETEPLPWIRPKLARALLVSIDQLNELLAIGPGSELASARGSRLRPAVPLGSPLAAHAGRHRAGHTAGYLARAVTRIQPVVTGHYHRGNDAWLRHSCGTGLVDLDSRCGNGMLLTWVGGPI